MAARSQPHPGQPCPAQPRGTFARPHPSLRNVHRISLPGSSSRPLRGVLAFPWGLGHFGHRGRVRPEKCRQKNTGKKIGEHGHGSSPHKQPASEFWEAPLRRCLHLRQAVLCSSKGQVRRVDASSVLAGVSKRPLPRDRAMLHLPCDSVGQQGATSVLCPSTDRAIALCLGSCPCPAAFRCSCSHVHEAPEPRLQWYSWPHVQEPIELRQSAVISRQLGFVEPFSFPG